MSDSAAARKVTNAKILGQNPEMNGRIAMSGVMPMRARVRRFGSVQRTVELATGSSAERLEHELRDRPEGFEHAVAAHRHRFVVGRAPDPAVLPLLDDVLARVARVGDIVEKGEDGW